ncbi:MEDS domain-containing protein [Natronolimnohabitans innermongolicus]|uniref:histidine kinase n=1 Tax=Natronolimnohabitans innermongolicus JCM 12255 TaxID=1227499 RepID=L9X6P6_9EURY|nr:MEDS domain-containing protein [Natronolimnohabitans innermongolicus]ELY57459.1 GAF sensor signal transduction histidine kinase [Natronolimnohabitans innermongolicus JCM 12255]
MSRSTHEPTTDHESTTDVLGLENEFESPPPSSEFSGSTGPVAEHDSYDHLALVYESREAQLETVVPFIEAGLERNERCLYIAAENDTETVLEAFRSADTDVDVDAALESDAFSIYSATETYLEDGRFDAEEMIAFLDDVIADADGVRITGEMSWVLDAAPGLEELMRYEGRLNQLLPDRDVISLCQYGRDHFPPEAIQDVIETHPHLIYDGTVCRNFYYTPPEEYFGPEQPERRIDRMMGTLVDRTEARAELHAHRRQLQRQNEIAGDPDRSFDTKLQELFELGCERFDLELGALARVDPDTDTFEIEAVSDDHDRFEPGAELPLSETYCTATTAIEATGAVTDPEVEGDDVSVYRELGLEAYLGTYIEVDGGPDRTFFFVDSDGRDRPFTDDELTVQQLLGQWIKYELEREHRDRHQQTLYEIAADLERSVEEKLRDLLDLGRERFGLEFGGIARVDPATDTLEVESVCGDHDRITPGSTVSLSETYCRSTVEDPDVIDVTEPKACGFEDALIYDEFGIETYLGTCIELEDALDRTVFFLSTDERDRPFSEAERTFLHLMGQWVAYELEREQREQALEESNERLEQFAYAASHDLQEPLRMITSYLQLIERRHGDALDDDGEEFLEYAVDGAERMREMIDGLLEYSRIETRGEPFEPVDLNDVLEGVLEDLQFRIEEHDAEITTAELPRVEGDASQLRQVFQNLLTNAITYSGDEPPRIRVDADRRGNEWIVSVEDDGIGIDPADQERVFTVFDRLHSREEYDGTGIGLALCERIVERHGGEIWLDSEPGEGATFSFTLPVTQ